MFCWLHLANIHHGIYQYNPFLYNMYHLIYCSVEFYKSAFQKQNNGASLTCLLPTVSNFRVHLLVSRTIWSLTCSNNEIKQRFNETLWDLMLSQIFLWLKSEEYKEISLHICASYIHHTKVRLRYMLYNKFFFK